MMACTAREMTVQTLGALLPPARLDRDGMPQATAEPQAQGATPMQIVCSSCHYSGDLAPTLGGEAVCPGCGSTIRNDRGTTAGWISPEGRRRLGRFELLGAVGTGAFGTVYEARDTELDRIVAIKVPRSDRLATQPGETERFLRE